MSPVPFAAFEEGGAQSHVAPQLGHCRMADLGARVTADGYAMQPGLLNRSGCHALGERCESLTARAGTRCLMDFDWCRDLARLVRERLSALGALAPSAVAVQCTFFEKSSASNWLVPVHQDLSVPVAARCASPDWRAWSVREGRLFVQPPIQVLQALLAVRIHLDECGADDGPLRVVPRSHRIGIVAAADAAAHRRQEVSCLADRGDALLMRPLVLHSSSKATGTSRRRVLHLLFGPPDLPDQVVWQTAA